jgi:hypothetical protein
VRISIEERIERIASTTHVVRVEDMSVYRVNEVMKLDDDVVFVECGDGLWFQDLDVFTLEEMATAETHMQKIRDFYAK